MASPTAKYTKKNTRKAKVNLIEKDTGLALLMLRPSNMDLDNGLGGNKPIMEIDEQGYETLVANNFGERKPVVNLTFSERNIDIVALSLNQKTQSVTATLRYPARQQIKKAEYNPSSQGKLGYSIIKDVETYASYQDLGTGETRILTQQNFDSFNPTIPKSFAIGDSFARKFSTDLVTDSNWTLLLPAADYAARSLAEGIIGNLELWALCFSTDDATEIVTVPDCFVNPEGAGLKDGDTSVKLDVSGIGACQPWNIYELTEEIFCDN